MKGAGGTSDLEVLVIGAKIIALSSALIALWADATNSKIRDNIDRIEVCINIDTLCITTKPYI